MADAKISALSDGTTPAGSDKFAIARSGANNSLTWTEMIAAMPGAEIGYDQITAGVTVASSTESSGTTIISCAAHTFDGNPVVATFSAPYIQPPATAAGDTVIVSLFEGATQIARLCAIQGSAASASAVPCLVEYRFTPTAASHTYTVTAHWTGHTGGAIGAGSGGTGAYRPAFIRFTKV